jgi:hypothetical protein
VQPTAPGQRAAIVWSADVAAGPQSPLQTAIHGHRLPGIQRLMAALAQTLGVRCGGVAVRHEHRALPSFRESGPFSSASGDDRRSPSPSAMVFFDP